jgi:uroporphyrin-III C-methyltransferase
MPGKLNTLKVISLSNTQAIQLVKDVFRLIPDIRYELKVPESLDNLDGVNSLSDKSLREFYVGELNRTLLMEEVDLAIQLAVDLPYPLPKGLEIIALLKINEQPGSNLATELSYLYSQVLSFNKDPLQGYLAVVSGTDRNDLKRLFSKYDIKSSFGKVTLVGFGPGNPDLLTLGGDKALAQAEYIFHDDLIDKEYLQKYPAEKVYVGKRKAKHSVTQDQINQLLLHAARAGKQVVRLKGGDPMVFAHGGEEIEYLQKNLVEVSVIPGVSAGFAASSYSKIPLTQRDISSSVAFISGHIESAPLPDTDTLVIYMGGATIQKIASRAIREGRSPDTPVVLIYNVSLPDQEEEFFSLWELSKSNKKFPTPVIIIIGEVVALRHQSAANLHNSLITVDNSPNQGNALARNIVIRPSTRREKANAGMNFKWAVNGLN